jgi:diacylglycerol kinase
MRSANLWRSFGYAFVGLAHMLRTQRNFRIHLAIAALVVSVGFYVDLTWVEWAIVTICIALVLIGEMMNTVVETIVDLASPEYHPLAKIAKDVAAAAVLLIAIVSVVVGLLVLGPHLLKLGGR